MRAESVYLTSLDSCSSSVLWKDEPPVTGEIPSTTPPGDTMTSSMLPLEPCGRHSEWGSNSPGAYGHHEELAGKGLSNGDSSSGGHACPAVPKALAEIATFLAALTYYWVERSFRAA